MDAVDCFAPLFPSPIKSKAEKTPAGGLGDNLETLHDAGNDDMLDGRIEIFGKLANHQEVHALESSRQPANVLDRPDRGEKSQFFAELDIEVSGLARRREQLRF